MMLIKSAMMFVAICCSCFKSSCVTATVRVSTAHGLDRNGGCSSNNTHRHSLTSAIDFSLDRPCSGNGWRRVAFLDMTDLRAACPAHLTLHTSPIRGCGQMSMSQFSCDSAIFPLKEQSYTEVCGRVVAYQKGAPEAFENYNVRNYSIESAYVDGISITHGPLGARQHIWTFAAARYEQDYSYNPIYACPCSNNQYSWPHNLPGFMEGNYFCDTGNRGPGHDKNFYYVGDPLWDGQGCGAHSSCCRFNGPPWFQTQLPQATSDDIELRLCFSLNRSDEDVIISVVELYVR